MKIAAAAAALIALCLCLASQARAQTEASLFSLDRLQLGAGLNHEWFSKGDDNALDRTINKEFTVGLYGSYNVIPPMSFIGFTKYGLDSKEFNSALGLRVTIFSGVE